MRKIVVLVGLEKFGILEKICDSTRKERKFSQEKMQESHGFYQYTQKNVWVSAGLQFEPQQKLGFDMMCIINQQFFLVQLTSTRWSSNDLRNK